MSNLLDECRRRWPDQEWTMDGDEQAVCKDLDIRVYDDGLEEGLGHAYGVTAYDCAGEGDTIDEAVDALTDDIFDFVETLRRVRRVLDGKPAEVTIGELMDAIMEPDADCTAETVRAEYEAAGLDYDAAEAKVLATIDEIDRKQKAGDNNCNTGRGPDGASE